MVIIKATDIDKFIGNAIGKKLLEFTPNAEKEQREWDWVDAVMLMPALDENGNDSYMPVIICKRKGPDNTGVYIPLFELEIEYFYKWEELVELAEANNTIQQDYNQEKE